MLIISFLSEFIGKKILDSENKKIGKFEDIIVSSKDPYPLVVAIVMDTGKNDINIPYTSIENIGEEIKLNSKLDRIKEYKTNEMDIKLVESVLDKQIVDVNDRKVKRVNDIEVTTIDGEYRLIGIGIGLEGVLKRLGIERVIKGLGIEIPDEYLTWGDIDISKSDKINLKLKKPYSQVKTLHPADMANIIEELDDKDMFTILNSLDEHIAASVLEELSSNRQICLPEGIDSNKATKILNLMSPDSATDLFGCLSEDRTEELLDLMNDKKANEIRKLLNYPPDSAGGIMTTEFVAVHEKYTAKEILDHLQKIFRDIRFIYYVYMVSNGVLTGTASLKDIIFADPDKIANSFMTSHLITVKELENQYDVAEKMAKYNLLAIPVINDKNEIKGIVTVDDAINVVLLSNWEDDHQNSLSD